MSTKNKFRSSQAFALTLSCGLLMLLMSTGCSTLNNFSNAPVPTQPNTPSNGVYQVEMTGGFGKTTKFQGQLTGPVTVQEALEAAGAVEKYRSMEIAVFRVIRESGQGLRMPVDYNSRSKSVSQEQNYALHPNDRIVVTSRSNNPLDKFVDSIAPALADY